LRGNEEFACEAGFAGAAAEGFFGGDTDQIGIVVFLRDMRHDEIASRGVEAFRIGEEFADGEIGKMAGAGENALLDDPGVGTDLKHVEIVIGFEDQAIGLAEMDFDQFRHIAEIGANGDLGAVGAESETDGVGGIVGNGESVDVNIADRKPLARLYGFNTTEAFAEGVRENALQSIHGGFGDIKGGLPEAENLRETIAMVGVFVGDENGVEATEVALDGGEARQCFAFAKASVYQDAGAFGFEQSKVARTAGSEDGDAQTDGDTPKDTAQASLARASKSLCRCGPDESSAITTFEIMAEPSRGVNVESIWGEEN